MKYIFYSKTEQINKALLTIAFMVIATALIGQNANPEPPDSVRQSHINSAWKNKEIKQYILGQTHAIEAAEQMKLAQKWDKAGNTFFITSGASLLTGGIVAATANSQEQLAWGLIIMFSSTLWSGAGSLCYMVSGHYFNQAVSIYLHPVKTDNGIGLNFQLQF